MSEISVSPNSDIVVTFECTGYDCPLCGGAADYFAGDEPEED